ncbi:MAG: aspartate kinase [Bacteroidetes bacterium]|nr:aspartate kinase [Bacteroidota bacterium]
MKVLKFGGASVNSADAVKNTAEIIDKYSTEKILVVVSAMGKTTNALEKLTQAYFNKSNEKNALLNEVKNFHFNIIDNLFKDKNLEVYTDIQHIFDELLHKLISRASESYDFEYDQIVSNGELISTKIISHYLNYKGIKNQWIDAREIIKTDNNYREGNVNWQETMHKTNNLIIPFFENNSLPRHLMITQGFIGSTSDEHSVTLGREGSDYSAAIFAYNLNASEMVIWKDVPGLLNADPKFFKDTHKLDAISYREAIELAYYGATIIHPKTIKPLQNKNIPLFVKSFIQPENEGSIISNHENADGLIPSFIFKQEQALISISPKDFSFIAEENLSDIFGIFSDNKIKINLMQNSAISFSVCIDGNLKRFDTLIKVLQENYKVRYNLQLDLITIRHYNQATIDKVVYNRKILLEQRSRTTAQLVVENPA